MLPGIILGKEARLVAYLVRLVFGYNQMCLREERDADRCQSAAEIFFIWERGHRSRLLNVNDTIKCDADHQDVHDGLYGRIFVRSHLGKRKRLLPLAVPQRVSMSHATSTDTESSDAEKSDPGLDLWVGHRVSSLIPGLPSHELSFERSSSVSASEKNTVDGHAHESSTCRVDWVGRPVFDFVQRRSIQRSSYSRAPMTTYVWLISTADLGDSEERTGTEAAVGAQLDLGVLKLL